MLFGGNSGSCGGCGCKSCQECTRGCTEPHTGTAFETVYTLFFEGVEAGNPTDGYLTATGDVDTSDPYDGMDGTGPWSQTVSGTFSLTKATTRYPCYVRVSFWRSNFVLGANTVPPPATTLTAERITVTNSGDGAIFADNVLLQPGESHQFENTMQLVAGAGDQSTNDKRFYNGTVNVRAACVNDFVSFTVSGHIAWDVKKRQHVLYGIVRECYEDPDNPPCATFCDGAPAPNALYLTISNLRFPDMPAAVAASAEGTYVLDRLPNICAGYAIDPWGPECNAGIFGSDVNLLLVGPGVGLRGNRSNIFDFGSHTACFSLYITVPAASITSLCGTGVLASGSNGSASLEGIGGGTFDWEIST